MAANSLDVETRFAASLFRTSNKTPAPDSAIYSTFGNLVNFA